jgi:putative ABC transport system permease protein
MSSLLLDVRHALRGLSRAPALAAAAILCIALGIGATTSIYAAVHTALLESLPFPQPERLVTVYRTTPQFSSGPFSGPNFRDLRRENRSMAAMTAITTGVTLVRGEDGASRVSYAAAAGDLAGVVGVQPIIGRMLRPDDAAEEAGSVALISHAFWEERYGGLPDVLGRTIDLDGDPAEIVGVLPPDFAIPHGDRLLSGDLWVPLDLSGNEARRSNFLLVLGRLADGWTPETAHDELRSVMAGIVEAFPVLEGEQLRVVPMHDESVRSVRGPLLLLLGAVGFVLLIAAANVASLLLARGAARRREWAVRTALGAAHGDVLRSAAVESGLLTGTGTLLGLLLAWAGVRFIVALLPSGLPQLLDLAIQPAVLGTAVAVAVVVGVVAGVGPAWQAQRSEPQETLRSGNGAGTGRGHHRFLRGLVIVEVALSLILLVGAGLVFRGFASLLDREPGFETERLLTLNVHLAADRHEDPVGTFLQPALERIEALPGVEEAGSINLVPYTNWGWNFNIAYEGRPADDPTRLPLVESRYVSPGFFETLDMRVVRGRLFEPADAAEGAPRVVVANEALARRDFPDADPVGARFLISDTIPVTIVGVVADIRNFGPDRDPRPEVYWNMRQAGGFTSFPLIVRATGDPHAIAASVDGAVREVDADVAVSQVRTMDEVIAASVGRPRFYLALIGIFAGVALLLALAGLYGVMSYVVARQTRELGIRSALGSTPADTLRFVLGSGLALVGTGAAIGLGGSFALSSGLDSFLYGVSPVDPFAWLGVIALLFTAAALALLVPGYRAARVDPVTAMRAE